MVGQTIFSAMRLRVAVLNRIQREDEALRDLALHPTRFSVLAGKDSHRRIVRLVTGGQSLMPVPSQGGGKYPAGAPRERKEAIWAQRATLEAGEPAIRGKMGAFSRSDATLRDQMGATASVLSGELSGLGI